MEHENDVFYIANTAIDRLRDKDKYDYLRINGTFDVGMKSLVVEPTKMGFIFKFSRNNITIKKNLDLSDVRYAEMYGKTISVGNNLIAAEDMHVFVKDNMVVKNLSSEWGTTFNFKSENAGTLEAPTLKIIEPLKNHVHIRITPFLTKNMYVSIGGFDSFSKFDIKQLYYTNSHSTKLPLKNTVYLSLNVIEDNYCETPIGENLDNWNPSTKLAIIKEGKYSQYIYTDYSRFSGGVKMLDGTLKFNFNQDRKKYIRKVGNSEDYYEYRGYPRQWPDTTSSHGDLEMIGGIFGSIDREGAYGAFRFTNIIYTDGTVNLRLAGPNKTDSIDLTSYYGRYNKFLKENIYRVDAELFKGGKISFTKNAKRFYFQFDKDLSWLISDVSADLKINDGKGAKVVSWDNGNDAGLSKDSFAANLFRSKDNKMYKPDFTVGSDGLYVKYVPVPEISQITAIIGTLALAFAAIRKRKGKN